jgi:hypothetical protein
VWPENIIVHLSSRIIASTKRLINRVFTSCLLHLLFYRCCVSVWINNNVGIYLFFFVNFLTVRIFFFFLKNEGCVCVWWFMQSESFQIFARVSHPMWNMYRDRCPRLNGGGVVARSRRPVNFSIFFLYLYLYTQHMCMGERVSHSSSLIYPSYQEE